MPPILMTDKPQRKTLPCAVPGCENTELIVSTFLQPEKARCPKHKKVAGKRLITPRVPTSVGASPEGPVEPNKSLADLRCPICDSRLAVELIEDDRGFMVFRCLGEDNTQIRIKLGSGGSSVGSTPPAWVDIKKKFNVEQRIQDRIEKEERLHGDQEAAKR